MSQLTKESLNRELERILEFWAQKTIDYRNGGFFGRIDHRDQILEDAPKGAVMNTRILWSFASTYSFTGQEKYLEIARRSYNYIREFFIDNTNGGVFWMLDHLGNPVDTKKQIYAQAFAIYGLAAYYEASDDPEALKLALDLFDLVEGKSFDPQLNGYFEAYDQKWNLLEDVRLSGKDQNEKKTMNTHLHVMEAYSTLYRVSGEEQVKQQLQNLVELFLHKFYASNGHFHLFFDENWVSRSDVVSYGHDIEAIWLIDEAARMLGDIELEREIVRIALEVAEATLDYVDVDGGLWYEGNDRETYNKEKHWWPQAEAMIGFRYAYEVSGDERYQGAVNGFWNYLNEQIIDQEQGEWIWGRNPDGSRMQHDKAGPWKAPYHNSRAMMEMVRRLQ